jgi:hypothetical protein
MNVDNMISWSPGVTLDEIEKQVILKAYRHFRGNKTTTANALGIAIRTLDHKLEKYKEDTDKQEKLDERARSERADFLARQRGTIERNQQTGADVYRATPGVQMEPASETCSESQMPMPKRPQVQKVLPEQTPKSGAGKNR